MTMTAKQIKRLIEIEGTMEELEAVHKALCKIIANPSKLVTTAKTKSFEVVFTRIPAISSHKP